MEDSANPPPVYAPYPTELPKTFPIGRKPTRPLVNVTELEAHLKILSAFNDLKDEVQRQDGIAQTDKNGAWALFLVRAVHRFDKWAAKATCSNDLPGFSESMIPPLDVVMVWHTYFLNPRTYYEDVQRKPNTSNFAKLDAFPLILLASLLAQPPSQARISTFTQLTDEPFDIPLVTSPEETCIVNCPLCAESEPISVPWVRDDNTGFGQRQFQATCTNFNRLFNMEAIGVRKFCNEVFERRLQPNSVFLAGTLLDPQSGTVDKTRGKSFNDSILKEIAKRTQYSAPHLLAAHVKYKIKGLETVCRNGLLGAMDRPTTPTPLRLARVLNAYRHGGIASIELSSAVLRQGSFIQKMVTMGWTTPDRFKSDTSVTLLVRAIARYHAFLDLMSAGPSTFFVPTLDIDLAWHTHQLNAPAYRRDTLAFLQRTPNHDDTVEQTALSTSYDITARAWKARFGVPYSVCGCAPDMVNTGSSILKFASKILGQDKPKPTNQTGIQNTRPDLISTLDDDADATHPSEHNSVVVVGYKKGETKSRARVVAIERRVKDATKVSKKNAEKQKGETWTDMQLRNRENRRADHQEAYLYTYPYWGIYPIGFYGYGGCGAYGGGVLAGGTGCAAGAGQLCSAGGCGSTGGGFCGAGCGSGGCGGGCGGGGCGGGCGGG